MHINRCHNVRDFRALARRALPAPMFHYMDGGADDEWTLDNNSTAFSRYELLPRVLVDVSQIDLKTRLLGLDMAMPFFLSPTGGTQMFHHEKELAVARAAADAGLLYTLSTVGTTRLEDVAAASTGPKMFQVYVFRDRGLTRELVARCKAAGYDALCLTVDTLVGGNRERDLRTGMSVPPRFTPASLFSFAMHPRWVWNAMRAGPLTMANVSDWVQANYADSGSGIAGFIDAQFDRTLNWKDAEWLAGEWGGPFVIKGLVTPDDALRARDVGASAVMLSNHGGRQLDGAPAPVDMVAPVRAAVGDTLELIVDGGIRRGTDMVKALALGADACSIGRAYLYALAAGGEAGVARLLRLLREELQRDMALLGCTSIKELDNSYVQRHKP